ncbi:MAG: hypothetical protein Q8Q24_00260, partial [bacterium]|nr:hypothetical protein [bacterium]
MEKQPQSFDIKKAVIRLGLAGLIWQAVQVEGGKSVNEPNVNIPLEYAVGKAKFSFFDWYKENITRQVINSLTPKTEASGNDRSVIVEDYFTERSMDLEPLVEDIIPNQLMQVLEQEGLYFPVNFRFGRPVTLFVSPRSELKITRQDVLRFNIAISEQDELKRRLEYSGSKRTDFSAAVIENGGMGLPLYPVVSRDMGLNDTYIAVAHEG